MRLSADWKGMFLRDGMAFAGTRPDRGSSDPYYGHAALYARSVYADAITLGLLQLRGITDLEEALADASDAPDGQPIIDLQQQLTDFRNRLWWQYLSAHGVPNQILAAFRRQHRLRERFEQILAEINDLSQLVRDSEMSNINNSAVLFTVITVPIGIGLALLQLLGHPGSAVFILVIAACLAVSFLALLTRPGKLAIGSVRRRLTS